MRIPHSTEIDRVVSLTRREWAADDLETLARRLTEKYKTLGGAQALWTNQARALAEAHQCDGLALFMPVGGGKTLVSRLLPLVLRSERPILLVPATLKTKTHLNFKALNDHWRRPRNFPVVSLEMIQQPRSRNMLDAFAPDLIIVDESQNIASHNSARTRRIVEYIRDNPGTKFCALSGSPIRLSLMDYWHIVLMALGKNAPLPKGRLEMEKWAEALDAEVSTRRKPGALGAALCESARPTLQDFRAAYRKRFNDSWGAVSIIESSCDMPINILLDSRAEVPPEIMEAVEKVRETGETADGEILESGAHARAHVAELANGFFSFFQPPPPDYWRHARKLWNKFVRAELDKGGLSLDRDEDIEKSHDSWALVERAFLGHPLQKAWRAVEDDYDPDKHRKLLRVSDYALKYAISRINGPTIVWVKQIETGEQLAKLSGWRYFGGGRRNSRDLTILSESSEAGQNTIILSINAHHQGQNLQAWHQAYYLCVPASVNLWEQSIGREHRAGQENAVSIEVFTPLTEMRESFSRALDRAKVIYQNTGQLQKILDAKVSRKNKRKKKK